MDKLTLDYKTNKKLREIRDKYDLTNEQIADLLDTSKYPWGKRVSIHRVNSWFRVNKGHELDPILLEKLMKVLGEEIPTNILIKP